MKIRKLVLFSSKLGINFSGGSNATVLLFTPILNHFEEVHLVAKEFGPWNHTSPFHHHAWKTFPEAVEIIKSLNSPQTLYYGDFYDSIVLVKAGVPFFFTYHDNWPEQKHLSIFHLLESFYKEYCYRKIFRSARHVFSVSHKKLEFINAYTSSCSVVRNGISLQSSPELPTEKEPSSPFRILMIGNLDQRKYRKALPLFHHIFRESKLDLRIEIFGHKIDKDVARKLSNYPFVTYQGFSTHISFENYQLLLSTSYIENLPISMVEAVIHKVPVLCFDVGGISELITHGEEGILIKPYQIYAMYSELHNILSGRYSFQFHPEKYTEYNWNKSAKRMLTKFREHLEI